MKKMPNVVPLLVAGCGVIVLLLGPLRAQESTPPAPPPAAEEQAPEATPADDEGLSADNSLSFPVDI